jgi:lysophospholipase L1-like esterase
MYQIKVNSVTNTAIVKHVDETINVTHAGRKGDKGDQGDPGQGVPAGGSTGQILTKDSNSDYDTSWQDPESQAVLWGSIGGDIENQTDLQEALDAKVDAPGAGDNLQTWLDTFDDNIVSGQPYREPTSQEVTDFLTGLHALMRGDTSSNALLTDLGFTIQTGIESVSKRPYTLVYNEAGTERAWGAYLFDRPVGGSTEHVAINGMIQAPHPVADMNTEDMALAMWRDQPGALLMISGTHRTDTTGTNIRDVAHQPGSMFHKVATEFADGGLPQFQQHGFADATDPSHQVVVSSGDANASRAHYRAADALEAAGFTVGRSWDGSATVLLGTTNTQGDLATSNGTTFIHIEVNSTVRTSSTLRDKYVAAIKSAVPLTTQEIVAPLLAEAKTGQFPSAVGSANSAGNSQYSSRSDHVHRLTSNTPVNNDTVMRISGSWQSRTPTQAKATLGLDQVDNTSDLNKPISTATQDALDLKADVSSLSDYSLKAADETLSGDKTFTGDVNITGLPARDSRYALRFPGSVGSYISLGTKTYLDGTPFTFGTWVEFQDSALSDAGRIWGYGYSSANNRGYHLRLDAAAKRLSLFYGSTQIVFNDTYAYKRMWLVLDFDGVNTVNVYVNNVLTETRTMAPRIADATIGSYLAARDTTSSSLNGLLDSTFLYNRVLTAAERKSIYRDSNNSSTYPSSGAQFIYLYNERTGTTATDSSASGNNATITGGTYLVSPFGNPNKENDTPAVWQAALSNADTIKTSALLIGSSTTQGGNATVLDNRYTDVLGQILHKQYNAASVKGGKHIRIFDSGWSTTGTTTLNDDGLGLHSRSLSAGATLSRTITESTGFDLHYVQGPGQGSFTVSVDGGSAVTVTPNTTGAANRHDGTYTVTGLTEGSHTILVTATNACIINGVYVHNGDATTGVRIYNSGLGGADSTDFVASNADTIWTRAATLDTSMVLLMLGSNDFSSSTDPDTFKDNVYTLIRKVWTNLSSTRPDVVLVNSYKRFDQVGYGTVYNYQQYAEKMEELAEEYNGVYYVDIADLYPLVNDSVNDPLNLVDTDSIHMTDAGHRFMARVLAQRLTPTISPAPLGQMIASQITNTPSGEIAATTVQAALNELDADKASITYVHDTFIDDTGGNIFGGFGIVPTYTNSSGESTALNVSPVIEQSGTAGYTGLTVNSIETSTGSGTKTLATFRVGDVNRFNVANTGATTIQNTGGDSLSLDSQSTSNTVLRFRDGGTEQGAIFAVNGGTILNVRSQSSLVLTSNNSTSSISATLTSSGLTMHTGVPLIAGTSTDILGTALSVLRNGSAVGRIDNNAGGLRVQAQAGTLQLRGSGNDGIGIDSAGDSTFAGDIILGANSLKIGSGTARIYDDGNMHVDSGGNNMWLDSGAGNVYISAAGSGSLGINTSSPSARLDVNSDTIRVRTARTPASAADTGNQGDITWDTDFVYVCVATNTWKRAALSTW